MANGSLAGTWETLLKGKPTAKFEEQQHLAYIDAVEDGKLFNLQAVQTGGTELSAQNLCAEEVNMLLQHRGIDPTSALWQ